MNETDLAGAAAVYANTRDVPCHEARLVNGVMTYRNVIVPVEEVPHRDASGNSVATTRG